MLRGLFSLGQMSPQYAHTIDTLVMTATRGEDSNITVDICGTQMVVHLAYANDDRVLGILYQHATVCLWCNPFATHLKGPLVLALAFS